MELLIGIAILAGLVWIAYSHLNKKREELRADNAPKQEEAPYKIEAPQIEAVPTPAPQPVESKALDLNNDGKVDLADAKEAVKKTKAVVKKTAAKAKTAVKKTAGRKPKSQKA